MNKCEIVKDLIPLYVENLTNESSNNLTKKHLEQCSDCKAYYEMVKEDYSKDYKKKENEGKADVVVEKLVKYQRNIKLISVLVAMFMSCIIMGARVQFLSTIPFLLITPFICRLFYQRSWPIILSSIPFALVGALLSGENSSFIPFFIVLALIFTSIGVLAAVVLKHGFKQLKMGLKVLYTIIALVILIFSSIMSFSFWGNPVAYTAAMIKVNKYVNQTYERDTLTFKGIIYNFKDSLHYGEYEYILNGVTQNAWIGFYRNGEVSDHYKDTLDRQFSEERSRDLESYIAASIDYIPINIMARPEEELNITYYEIDDVYYHLTFDKSQQNKATAVRRVESAKLSYEISFGAFIGKYSTLSKDEFLGKAINMFNNIKNRNMLMFKNIEIKSYDEEGKIQSISFDEDTSQQGLIDSYRTMDEFEMKD